MSTSMTYNVFYDDQIIQTNLTLAEWYEATSGNPPIAYKNLCHVHIYQSNLSQVGYMRRSKYLKTFEEITANTTNIY
jgi:hypothetical protein